MAKQLGFIVDTNKYSGNFERQMCAFMTGHTGDCGVGRKEKESFLEEFTPIEEVMQRPDEHRTLRPVTICPTPNVWNNGLGFHFVNGQEELALQKYKEYVMKDKQKWIEITEGHRGKNLPTWTEKAIDQTIKRYKSEINEAMLLTKVSKYPAYESVLIYLSRKPSEHMIEFMESRSYEFAEIYGKDLEIINFRLL